MGSGGKGKNNSCNCEERTMKTLIIISIIFISSVIFSNQSYASTGWTDNLIKWVLEGKISALDYTKSMEYLHASNNQQISNSIRVHIIAEK